MGLTNGDLDDLLHRHRDMPVNDLLHWVGPLHLLDDFLCSAAERSRVMHFRFVPKWSTADSTSSAGKTGQPQFSLSPNPQPAASSSWLLMAAAGPPLALKGAAACGGAPTRLWRVYTQISSHHTCGAALGRCSPTGTSTIFSTGTGTGLPRRVRAGPSSAVEGVGGSLEQGVTAGSS